MAGIEWTQDEVAYLMENAEHQSCQKIAEYLGRTIRSVQHKFNYLGLSHKKAEVGDVVNGWEIIGITSRKSGNQNISYAKIRSTLGDGQEKEDRLTKLTLRQIGWPDRRRPDVIERNKTHGSSRTRLYRIWNAMKNRCTYSKGQQFKDYGGRGIKVCDEWMKFETFKIWAESHSYTEELTLDRINVNLGYSPDNCKWSTWAEQGSNKRNSSKLELTAFGETKSVYEWVADNRCSVNVGTLQYRYAAGWTAEEAITKISERKTKLSPKEFFQQNHPEAYEEYLNQ